jgi:DNA primase
MHLAKKEVKKLDFCYVVEGYTDVIALFQFGIKNVVSSCGTALTKDQIRLIHRFTKNIGILFDSDNAGVNATLKAIDEVLKAGMNPKILQLPQGEDPSSFLQKENKETVHDYIQKNTINFIDFKYQLIDPEDTAALINTTKSIIHSISLINDSISQSFHIKETAKKLSLNELDVLKELQNQNKAHLQANIKKQKQILRKDDSVNKLNFEIISRKYLEELQLIRLLINYGSTQQIIINDSKITVAEFIVLELEKDSKDINSAFSVPLFNKILNEIKNKINLQESISKDYFINHANLEFREVSAYVIGEKHLLGNWEDKDIIVIQEEDILAKVTTESILRFKLKRVQEILKELLVKLKNESTDHQSIIKQFSKLSKVEKKIQQKLGRIF